MNRWVGVGVTVTAFPLLVASSAAAAATLTGPDTSVVLGASIFLVPVALYGAVVAKTWTLGLPVVWYAVVLAVLRLVDLATGGCSVCGSDLAWGEVPWYFFVIGVLPMTGALLVGLLVGVTIRRASLGGPPTASG